MNPKDKGHNPSHQTEFSAQVVDVAKLQETITRLTTFIVDRPILGKDAIDPPAQEFAKKAAEEATAFKLAYEKEANILTPESRKKISEWVSRDESEAGGHQLEQVGRAAIQFWSGMGRREGSELERKMAGHPGHDKRHLLEDLMAGLAFRYDVVTDTGASNDEYQKIGLIGSFMHDIGRLVEERVTKKQQGGEAGDKHAEMSFYITRQLLDSFPTLDPSVRDHVLYSVLVHQQWPKKELENTVGYKMTMNEPLNRSVMGSDRLQLVGPEGILRFIAFDIGEAEKPLSFTTKMNLERKTALDNKAETSINEHIEFYMRNLLPVEVPGSSEAANKKANLRSIELRAISGAYLWEVSSDEEREIIYGPEFARDRGQPLDEAKLAENKKRILPPEVWAQIKMQVDIVEGKVTGTDVKSEIDQKTAGKSVSDLATHLISAENASVTKRGLEVIKSEADKVTDPAAVERLKRGLVYAMVSRNMQDKSLLKVAASMQNNVQLFPNHTLERTLAQFVLNNFPQTAPKAATH